MFKKIIGKTCRNPECEFKDQLKEDYITVCDCGHALEDVTVPDKKKIAILTAIVALLLSGGGYFGAMMLMDKAKKAGKEIVQTGVTTVMKEAPKVLSDNKQATSGTSSIVSDPKGAIVLVSDGLKLARENKIQDALEKFKLAAEKDSNNDEAFGNMSQALFRTGQLDEALQANTKAISLKPNNPIWHLNMAEIYSKRGNKDLSLIELEAAVNNGFKDVTLLKSMDFKNIVNEEKYKQIMGRLR